MWDISKLKDNPIREYVDEKLFIRAHKGAINYAEIFYFDGNQPEPDPHAEKSGLADNDRSRSTFQNETEV